MNMELYSDQGLYLGSRLTTNLIYPRANTSSIGLHTDLGLTIPFKNLLFILNTWSNKKINKNFIIK